MSKVKFPPRVRIFCAFDNFERKIKVSGADRYFGIPMNPPGKPYEAISIAEHESKISQLEERLRIAESRLERLSNDAKSFYTKWEERLGNHPLVGYAYEVELISNNALAAIKEKKE